MSARRYRYVGPLDVLAAVRPGSEGQAIGSPSDLAAWLRAHEPAEPFTFVVDLAGVLRLAPRRSEHVACAGGAPVLGAGEITFTRDGERWTAGEVSNQSTGYCPDLTSWVAVRHALDRAGVAHPGRFTAPPGSPYGTPSTGPAWRIPAGSPRRSSSASVPSATSATWSKTTISSALSAAPRCPRDGTSVHPAMGLDERNSRVDAERGGGGDGRRVRRRHSRTRWRLVSDEDGPFGGVLTPCDMCLEVGELVTLDGRPPQVLRVGECPQCRGSGHVHIDCEEHEVDDVVRGLPPTRRQVAVRRMVAGVGMCADCFGVGSVAHVECDADRAPIRYVEAPCPKCTATN